MARRMLPAVTTLLAMPACWYLVSAPLFSYIPAVFPFLLLASAVVFFAG